MTGGTDTRSQGDREIHRPSVAVINLLNLYVWCAPQGIVQYVAQTCASGFSIWELERHTSSNKCARESRSSTNKNGPVMGHLEGAMDRRTNFTDSWSGTVWDTAC